MTGATGTAVPSLPSTFVLRQMGGAKPITVPADLIGVRMRIPAGQVYEETFRALGAEPVAINADGIYDALKTGKVDAQENPLAIVDLFKIYEVLKYISMSNHMWSGFNLLAHLPTWKRLPNDIQAIIERNAAKYVALQRRDQQNFNKGLRAALAQRGVVFNDVDTAPIPRETVQPLRNLEGQARHQVLVVARSCDRVRYWSQKFEAQSG